jgi:hypothetical protein
MIKDAIGRVRGRRLACAISLAAGLLSGCGGGGGDGPAIEAVPQTLAFDTAPTLMPGSTATVSATASSGLPVSYASMTPTVCSVDAATGVVTAASIGDCRIAATQHGDAHYAPAATATLTLAVQTAREQIIVTEAPPTLGLYGLATVSATSNSGLPVSFSTATPAICSVLPATGLVTDLAAGDCVIVARQDGDALHEAATPVTITLTVVDSGSGASVPTAPQGVSATLASTGQAVAVSFASLGSSGGSPATRFTAVSVPGGLSASATSSPITVPCPDTCSGYAFVVFATNASGDGPSSTAADVVTSLDVTTRFFEPDTQPNDSIFKGSFRLNSTTSTVTGLAGTLTESMTGSGTVPMTTVVLAHQLSVVRDGNGALRITTFALDSSDVFSPGGFADTENGIYFGHPAPYDASKANSFITIYIDAGHPTAPLTAAQIDTLVYGDCAPGGMMGAACMTGAVGGGTMGGYPVSQSVTAR